MNKLILFTLMILALKPVPDVISQNKLAIDDRSGILEPGVRETLRDRPPGSGGRGSVGRSA